MVKRQRYVPEVPAEEALSPRRFRPEVYLYDDPSMVAMVIQQGPEQSEIKFANGNIRYVVNEAITWIK